MKVLRVFALLACSMIVAANAQAEMVFTGAMTGANENPPNGSTATGFTSVTINDALTMMTVQVTWAGITGGTPSAAHIHCCTPQGTTIGVAVGFPGFPNTLSGSYSNTFDLLNSSIYTNGFLTTFGGGTAAGARDALIAGLTAGTAYANIHNTQFSGGEIRADLAPVPLPAAGWLLLSGLGLVVRKRRQR